MKDLIDLVILATTQVVNQKMLHNAVTTEATRRNIQPIERFTVPVGCGTDYRKMASENPACVNFLDIESAMALMARFIDPALHRSSKEQTWSPDRLQWVT